MTPGSIKRDGKNDKDSPQEESGDLAFEHRKSGSIISVNSVCREYRDASLEELSRYLLLGLNTTGPIATRDIEVDDTKALESTVSATMVSAQSGSAEVPVQVRAVVLRKNGCTFDLMFIARPESFDAQAPVFERFLKGFHAN